MRRSKISNVSKIKLSSNKRIWWNFFTRGHKLQTEMNAHELLLSGDKSLIWRKTEEQEIIIFQAEATWMSQLYDD